MRHIQDKQSAKTNLTTSLKPVSERLRSGGITEGRLRRDLANRKAIEDFKSRSLTEGPQSLNNLVTLVMLKGTDVESVKKTVESLRSDNPTLNFQVLPEPADDFELPTGTAVLVFVANGSTKGVDALLKKTSERRSLERIATVLVSEHEDETDRFDHKMHFDRAIKENRLLMAVNAAVYYRRGETFPQ